MRQLAWIAGGLAAGLLGAILWVTTAYFAGIELGIIALGIGVLSGFGVRLMAKETHGKAPAVAAVVACLLSIGAGKVGHTILSWPGTPEALQRGALIQLSVLVARDYERAGRSFDIPDGGWEIRHTDYPEEIWVEAERRWNALTPEEQAWYLKDVGHIFLLDRELTIAKLAADVVEEHKTANRPVNWPPGVNPDALGSRTDFPAAIWQEAEDRWEAFSPEEQRELEEVLAFMYRVAAMGGHISTVFSLQHLFWFALATVPAWLVGSGKMRASFF